jgi:hypothetical protein
MMGKGFFVDLKNWEVIPIAEHFDAVKANPARYRMKKSDVPKNRDKALIQVLRRGFVRVREDYRSGVWHVEGKCSWTDLYAASLVLGRKIHLPAHAFFYLVNLDDLKNSPREMTLRELMKEVGIGEMRKIGVAIRKLQEKSDRTLRKQIDEAVDLALKRK